MRLILISTLLLATFLATSGCKEYSTGLQQGSSRSDETSAVATLRTIAQAQTAYSISNAGQYGTFEQLSEAGLLDSRFSQSNPEFHGYVFTMQTRDNSGTGAGFYSCNADPAPTSFHGGRHFYIDSSSHNIRMNPTQPATDKDEILRP